MILLCLSNGTLNSKTFISIPGWYRHNSYVLQSDTISLLNTVVKNAGAEAGEKAKAGAEAGGGSDAAGGVAGGAGGVEAGGGAGGGAGAAVPGAEQHKQKIRPTWDAGSDQERQALHENATRRKGVKATNKNQATQTDEVTQTEIHVLPPITAGVPTQTGAPDLECSVGHGKSAGGHKKNRAGAEGLKKRIGIISLLNIVAKNAAIADRVFILIQK